MKRPKISRHEATALLLLVASLALVRLVVLLITEGREAASSWLFLVCAVLAMGCSLLVLLGE